MPILKKSHFVVFFNSHVIKK